MPDTTIERKPYETPEILHELELETRAGTVIQDALPFDELTGIPTE